MRLCSNRHTCVGVGHVRDGETAAETLHRGRRQLLPSDRQKRVIDKVGRAFKPAAYPAHRGPPPASAGVGRMTMKDIYEGGVDSIVKCNVSHVRLTADWTAPSATPVPSTSPNASAVDHDDADVVATEAP